MPVTGQSAAVTVNVSGPTAQGAVGLAIPGTFLGLLAAPGTALLIGPSATPAAVGFTGQSAARTI